MEKANTPAAVAAQLDKAAADTETIAAALSLMVCKQKPPTKIQTQARKLAAVYREYAQNLRTSGQPAVDYATAATGNNLQGLKNAIRAATE